MSQPIVPSTPAPSWRGAIQDLSREHGFEPLRVEGDLPAELEGTLYRNGPALFSSFGESYGHWFDGDGAVSAIRLEGGRAEGAVRIVQSEGLVEERRAGRRLHGIYGTPRAGGPLARLRGKDKNVANISVLPWDGRLFALYEGGRPTEISSADLSTIGETDLDGLIAGTLSAHLHRIPKRKATYGYGLRYGRVTVLDVYELRDGGEARRLTSIPLPYATMIHDFVATERSLVFFIPPVRLRIFRQLLGAGTPAENFVWNEGEGTEVVVVPIDEPERLVRFAVDPFYQWHFVNAFERGEDLVVDLVRYHDFATNHDLGSLPGGGAQPLSKGRLHRTILDPRRRTARSEELWDRPCEFPRIAPDVEGRPYRFAYLAAHPRGEDAGLFSRIARFDVESGRVEEGEAGKDRFVSEPIFVPRPGGKSERDGWVLAHVYDAGSHTTHLAVWDARELGRGPIARAHFDHHLPPTFHGAWKPGR